jgi:carbon-monoxide dehydrogenase small subunit
VKRVVKFKVNGDEREVYVEPQRTLLEVLRDDLDLTGAKYSCGTGECGACTVLVDGKAVLSCLTLAVDVEGKAVLTVEGMAAVLPAIQQMFVEHGAIQCGFCTPGFVMTAKALLDENPNPTEEEVKDYIRGNLCRCGNYVKIVDAIMATANMTKGKKGGT